MKNLYLIATLFFALVMTNLFAELDASASLTEQTEPAYNSRETIYIGTGTSTQRQPFGVFWGYERSASIYRSSEINTSGNITRLDWYCTQTVGSSSAAPTRIFLIHTALSSFTSTGFSWSSMISNATLVYQANLYAGNSGWAGVNLQTPFFYNGTGNLMVLVETNYGGNGTSTYPLFRYSSSSSRHQEWYQDNTPPTGNGSVNSYRPNIGITIPSPSLPDLITLGESVNDHTLAPGESFSVDYQVKNQGDGPAG